jgi:peptide/nickel transport system substrate-binding protein
VLRAWRPRDQVILDANPAYWGGKPKVDHLIFKELPDPQAAVLALKRGDVQILADLSTQAVPALKSDGNVTVLTQPGLSVSGVALPVDTPPFNDKRVRQALNDAVDKAAINKALFAGLAVPLTSPLPQAQWGFDATLTGTPLADAGVTPGTTVELATYSSPRGTNLAIAVQGTLAKVGLTDNVKQSEVGAYFTEVRSGKYAGLMMEGWSGDNGDPDNFLGELWSYKNFPTADWARTDSPAKRTPLYAQAQKLVVDDAPWIFINSTLQIRAVRKGVTGYELNPTQMFFGTKGVGVE